MRTPPAGAREADAPSALDGIGADQRVSSARRSRPAEWPDRAWQAFDTDRYYVICSNLIAPPRLHRAAFRQSPTDRPYGPDFPVVTVGDMVRAQAAFLDALGIESLLAVAGGSLGGMQALDWARPLPDGARVYPDRLDRAPIARASPGTRSRGTPSWPTPTGRAGATTARAGRHARGSVLRGWSGTSPTYRPRR